MSKLKDIVNCRTIDSKGVYTVPLLKTFLVTYYSPSYRTIWILIKTNLNIKIFIYGLNKKSETNDQLSFFIFFLSSSFFVVLLIFLTIVFPTSFLTSFPSYFNLLFKRLPTSFGLRSTFSSTSFLSSLSLFDSNGVFFDLSIASQQTFHLCQVPFWKSQPKTEDESSLSLPYVW